MQRLIEKTGLKASHCEVALTQAEVKYNEAMKQCPEGEFNPGEIACVGAGIRGGFANTKELHVMKYDEAMNCPDKAEWKQAVEQEYN